jgi:hypothetical protein
MPATRFPHQAGFHCADLLCKVAANATSDEARYRIVVWLIGLAS